MSVDDETEESQCANTFDAGPISEINTEIDKPTLLDKQIPTKAFSPFDLQHLGEVKFQSLSPKTISTSKLQWSHMFRSRRVVIIIVSARFDFTFVSTKSLTVS